MTGHVYLPARRASTRTAPTLASRVTFLALDALGIQPSARPVWQARLMILQPVHARGRAQLANFWRATVPRAHHATPCARRVLQAPRRAHRVMNLRATRFSTAHPVSAHAHLAPTQTRAISARVVTRAAARAQEARRATASRAHQVHRTSSTARASHPVGMVSIPTQTTSARHATQAARPAMARAQAIASRAHPLRLSYLILHALRYARWGAMLPAAHPAGSATLRAFLVMAQVPAHAPAAQRIDHISQAGHAFAAQATAPRRLRAPRLMSVPPVPTIVSMSTTARICLAHSVAPALPATRVTV
mmetsp:Transcript_27803/g.70951  ORF Transcript_27803/g.70951 Transcript_27803/m.70951 type:complete len:304 (+) Transcript_27803:1866-2777(+)